MKRCMFYWAIVGALLPGTFMVLHAYASRSIVYKLDSAAPLVWPSSFLLLGLQDPAYPLNVPEFALVLYSIGIHVCLYAAVGGILWKARAWWKEQNRLHGGP